MSLHYSALRAAALATAALSLLLAATATGTQAKLPVPAVAAPAEPFGAYQAQTTCSSTAKPGVLAFQQLVLSNYRGSRNLGIVRGCGVGGRSEHKEGRAWDWGVRLDRPAEKAYAEDVISWLLATDAIGVRAANARRLGIMYIIWNRKIWTANRADEGWRAYWGPNPHVDHVHISWTWPGAYKLTSYWTGKPYGVGAAGGLPDATWGTAGWTPLDATTRERLINTVQWPDGRLWSVHQSTVGNELVIDERSYTSGLGVTFAGSNRVRLPLPANTTVNAATLTTDGHVAVAGSTVPAATPTNPAPLRDAFVMRINGVGAVDTGFGVGGVVTTDLGGDDDVRTIAAISSDVAIGGSTTANGAQAMVLTRLTRSGARAAYGVNGTFTMPAGGPVIADTILALADGAVVAGCRNAAGGCVTKVTRAGALDTSFGIAGTNGLGFMTPVTALAPGLRNTIYLTGRHPDGAAHVFRLTAGGLADTTFGVAGLSTVSIPGCTMRPSALAVRSDGSALIGGLLDGCGDAFVARLVPDGPIDPRWGNSGIAGIGTLSNQPIEGLPAVLLQTDGHVVVAASGGAGADLGTALGRFTTLGPVPARTVALRSTATLTYGSAVTVTAVVRSSADFGLTSGAPIVFEARPFAGGAWRKIGTATTVDGAASITDKATRRMVYRTRSGATETVLEATSAEIDVRVAHNLAVAVKGAPAGKRLLPKQPATLSVTALPEQPGRRVWLQRLERGKWKTVTTRVLDAKSQASFRLAAKAPVTWQFRWVLHADAERELTMSATIPVVWYSPPKPPAKPAAKPPAKPPAAPKAPAKP